MTERAADPISLFARLVGAVLLLIAIALGGLCLFAAHRLLSIGGQDKIAALIVCGVVAFGVCNCALMGYRLALGRPNQYGSLAPPWGWYALALVFAVLCLLGVIVALRFADYLMLLGTCFSAMLAAACARAGWQAARRHDHATASVLAREFAAAAATVTHDDTEFITGIELFNDDTTPMEFVVAMLTEQLHMAREPAIAVMLKIHRSGRARVALDGMERSHAVAAAISAAAAAAGHQFVCRAVDSRAPA